jgi:hypothetical protein
MLRGLERETAVKTALRLALPALVLGLTGCFDVDQDIALQPDLSGKATLHVVIDMEPGVPMIARMQRQMMGAQGEPTAEDLEGARAQMIQQQEQGRRKQEAEFEARRAAIIANLPAGVTLGDVSIVHSGLMSTMNVDFTFDHVSKLAQITMPKDEPKAGGGGRRRAGGAPTMEKPFENLVVEETDTSVRLSMRPTKVADPKDMAPPGAPPGIADGIKEAMAKATYTLTITSPMAIAETNATERTEGGVVWTWDQAGLEAQAAGTGAVPTVVFTKQ